MTMQMAAYGRLTSDPVLRESKAGKPWATGRVAVDAGTKDDEQQTLFVGIVAFGKTAEKLLRHAKGDPLSVSGRCEINAWTDSEGATRQELKIIADAVVSAKTVRPGGRKKQAQDGASRYRDEAPFDDAMGF